MIQDNKASLNLSGTAIALYKGTTQHNGVKENENETSTIVCNTVCNVAIGYGVRDRVHVAGRALRVVLTP